MHLSTSKILQMERVLNHPDSSGSLKARVRSFSKCCGLHLRHRSRLRACVFLPPLLCAPSISPRIATTASRLISLPPPSALGPSSTLSQRIILEQKPDAQIPPRTPSGFPSSLRPRAKASPLLPGSLPAPLSSDAGLPDRSQPRPLQGPFICP